MSERRTDLCFHAQVGASRRTLRAAVIESLEPRRLLAVFANGIDSDNLGEGVWAWGLRSAMSNLGFGSNYSAYFNYVHNTQGAQYIIIKAADGNSVYNNPAGQQSYTTTVRNAAHAAGLKIFPYFYIRGTSETELQGEISVFNSIVSSVGADGVVFDIEGDWDNFTVTKSVNTTERDSRIVEYFNGIGKSPAGNGSGSRDSMFMAYSSFPYVSFHSEVPFLKLGDYLDAAMPQPYWAVLKNSPSGTKSPTPGQSLTGAGGPSRMVKDVDSEYRMTSLQSPATNTIFKNHPESVKPVIMTGQMYGTATASEIAEFYNAVKNDTTAVGNGQVAGYKYKSVNFFDEDTAGVTTQAQLDALSTLSIGDLPGVATSPSLNNTSTTNTTPTLDWADVVNTYGSPSTGAATSYDVYLDGVFKANVTSSTYSVPSALAAGSHTWRVDSNDIIGTTTGTTWSFTVDTTPPTIADKGFQAEQAPPYLSFTFSEPVAGIDLNTLTFINLDSATGAVPSVTAVQYPINPDTAHFLLNTNLPNGNFRATLAGVTDAAGNALAGTKTIDFYFLRGDATGDRVVNALDFNALASHFGSSGAGFSQGDSNFDGVVDTADFSVLASNWANAVPALPVGSLSAAPANLFGPNFIRARDQVLEI